MLAEDMVYTVGLSLIKLLICLERKNLRILIVVWR